MSTQDYREVWTLVQHLSLEEQHKLLGDLNNFLKPQMTLKPMFSILELEGLGKEVWEGVDVDQYLEQERDAW
jgi:hypothetical protein